VGLFSFYHSEQLSLEGVGVIIKLLLFQKPAFIILSTAKKTGASEKKPHTIKPYPMKIQ
jgi:hypothetical protein